LWDKLSFSAAKIAKEFRYNNKRIGKSRKKIRISLPVAKQAYHHIPTPRRHINVEDYKGLKGKKELKGIID